MAKQTILIAGNICAGKTDLVSYIEKHKNKLNPFLEDDENVSIIPEFIDPTALELFYKDRKEHSVTFEDSCLRGRINRHLKAKYSTGICIFDRGMIEGAETFSKNSFQEGFLSHDNYESYIRNLKRGLDQLDRTQQPKWLEQLVVYLRIDDEDVLVKRQKQRATANEVIDPEYLKTINKMYESFFSNIKAVYAQYAVKAPRVITVDATKNFNEDKNYHTKILNQIVEEMEELENGN